MKKTPARTAIFSGRTEAAQMPEGMRAAKHEADAKHEAGAASGTPEPMVALRGTGPGQAPNDAWAPQPAEDRLRSVTIEVDGTPMHTLVSDEVSAAGTPPVVLVHGLGLSGRYMQPTAHVLLHHHRVYLPDLPGFGDSAKPRHVLDVPELADALSAWMRAAGIERAMLLGNSFGCQIIAELAARHHEQVQCAVLQGPTAPPEERTWLRQFLSWRANAPFMPGEMNEIAHSDYRKCGIVRALRTFSFSINHAMEELLPHIRAPMLVVRGERDPICHQHWAQAISCGLERGRLLVLPGVAHTLVFTSPLALAGACLPFFEECLTSERREHRP